MVLTVCAVGNILSLMTSSIQKNDGLLNLVMAQLKRYMPVIAVIAVFAAVLVILWSIFGVRYRTVRLKQARTFIEMTAKTDKASFEKLILSVTNEIRRLNAVVNVYDPKSELSELNHRILNGGRRIQLSDEMARLLSEGLFYAKETGGKYDITIRPVMMLWGF
ncbi:MAG: FAD:protein FMN transferase, partial [Spirochaetota bacterium]